jgi:hypothetical protein
MTLLSQMNIKVGYSYHRPNFDGLNNLFNAYNAQNPNLIEGFGKTSAISSLDLGLRSKLSSNFGFEIGGKYGQSGINKATFSANTEKWSTRYSEFNAGLFLCFNSIYIGGSINRSDLAVTKNEPATRKYPSIDKSSFYSSTFYVAFEAKNRKSSISIRPFYQLAFSNIELTESKKILGINQGGANEINPSGFGISLIICNGEQ